jgi:hypothetical protein
MRQSSGLTEAAQTRMTTSLSLGTGLFEVLYFEDLSQCALGVDGGLHMTEMVVLDLPDAKGRGSQNQSDDGNRDYAAARTRKPGDSAVQSASCPSCSSAPHNDATFDVEAPGIRCRFRHEKSIGVHFSPRSVESR